MTSEPSSPAAGGAPPESVPAAARSAVPWVVPFLVFIGVLAVQDWLAPLGRWEAPARVAFMTAVLWVFSRNVITFATRQALASIAIGLLVFAIWIGPDLLVPGYRQHWLFQNGLTGRLKVSTDPALLTDPMVLLFRSFRAVLLVPILEELFWRGWLMRWLINSDFWRVPLGAYAQSAFWITALLFASEHGPFWDVGLIAGVIYNWWMVRTKSLGDCILAHAVTNAALCAYVIVTGEWQYWL
jgi:CAAX prenyl protease-like protein